MAASPIRPTTIEGIKRLANSIRKTRGLRHAQALDAAGVAAGYENYAHALRALEVQTSQLRPDPSPYIALYLSAPWKDPKTGTSGREILHVALKRPWSDLVTPPQFKVNRALMGLKRDAPDQLAWHSLASAQSHARRRLCAAARTLGFMDATGLRPSSGSLRRALAYDYPDSGLPGMDHPSVWYHHVTRRYLVTDEPYELAAKGTTSERAAWFATHGIDVARPEWTGMYNPDGGSQLYLLSKNGKGIPLDPVVEALNVLGKPITEKPWSGMSTELTPFFHSPGWNERGTERPSRVQARLARGPRASIGYHEVFGRALRRPKGRMPIQAHAEVGRRLKTVIGAAQDRAGVANPAKSVRHHLDEWVMREYTPAELPDEVFHGLYMGGTTAAPLRRVTPEARLHLQGDLTYIRQILQSHYPECAPLRRVMKKLDGAARSLAGWGA